MSEKKKPVCQWATCPRHREVAEGQGWVAFQYHCVDRLYDQDRGTYVCDPENTYGSKGKKA